MNIIVKPYCSDTCYCRPDTTWERENKDFYCPECVEKMYWTPIMFARISKAGKCIGEKFASRYYDAIGFGALMYIGEDLAFASCADHTSLLPAPLYNPVVLEGEDNIFEVRLNGTSTVRSGTGEHNFRKVIEDTIRKASSLTSLRIGDFVAVELQPMSVLAVRDEGDMEFSASFCDNELYKIKIIF